MAREQLVHLCQSWMGSQWNEMDYDRVKELQTRELLMKRTELVHVIHSSHSLTCPQFLKHVKFRSCAADGR